MEHGVDEGSAIEDSLFSAKTGAHKCRVFGEAAIVRVLELPWYLLTVTSLTRR